MATALEKRLMVRNKYKTIIGKNIYSQSLRDYCYKLYKDGKYYSDCSSSICYRCKNVIEQLYVIHSLCNWLCMNGIDESDLLLKVEDANGFVEHEVAQKNCVNCIHYNVCMTVANRKTIKANDYSPCEQWRSGD